jgi:sugar lactone lactonase YvrE
MKKFFKLQAVSTVLAFLMAGLVFGEDYSLSTVAGGGASLGDGGNAAFAQLIRPSGVAVDSMGSVYVADTLNHRVRKVDIASFINTIAGNGIKDFSGDLFTATAAQLNNPSGVAVDTYGNVYIADTLNSRIRKVDSSGNISTVAGSAGVVLGDGGSATSASLKLPVALAIDSTGNIYIADKANNSIRKVDTLGTITEFAGTGTAGYSGDGAQAGAAQLYGPSGVAVDTFGNVYIADTLNNRIRKVDTAGIITTIAGNGTANLSGDGGQATAAQLNNPFGVAVDAERNVFVADTNNNCIRKINVMGIISTIASNMSQFSSPQGIAVDTSVHIFVADTGNNVIRKIIPNE